MRMDHDRDGWANSGEAAILTDCIYSATETVLYYLFHKYTPARLATSWWAWRRATILAAYELDRLRNNPPSESLADWAAQAQEEMQAVADGPRIVPGLPMRMTMAPKWSNIRIDQTRQFRIIRVEKKRSSSVATPQSQDWQEAHSFEI